MIFPDSVPSLPVGIQLKKNKVVDHPLNREHSINKISYVFLVKIDGKKSIKQITTELVNEFTNVTYEQIEMDLIHLLLILNDQHAINVKTPLKTKIMGMFLQLIQFKRGKSLKSRIEVSGTSYFKLIINTFLVLQDKVIWLYLLAALNSAGLMILLPFLSFWYALLPILLAIGFIGSVAIHEATHLYFLRKLTKQRDVGHFEFRKILFRLVRPKTDHEAVIGVSAPLVVSGVGVVMTWIGIFITDPLLHIFWLFLAGVFLIHILALLPFSNDGKKLMDHFIQELVKGQYQKGL